MVSDQSVSKVEMKIPRKLLLLVYLIVPFLGVIALADYAVFDSYLLPYMGIEALLLPAFIFLFNFPHIIASFFSFFDSEYITHYKQHLFLWLPLLLVGTASLLYYHFVWGVIFFLINDVWHGVKQKVGIALILGAKPGWTHHLWTLAPFVTSTVAYIYFLRPSTFPSWFVNDYFYELLLGGIIIMLITMIGVLWSALPKARWYIFAVSMLFLTNYFFVLAGYIFFAILAFRFVHDISAFAFYVTHDHNRNYEQTKNKLYRLLKFSSLPMLFLAPLFAYVLAFGTRELTDSMSIVELGFGITILISMAHYYLESVMWKRGSLHRQHVQVAD